MGIVLRNALLLDLDPIGVEAGELRVDAVTPIRPIPNISSTYRDMCGQPGRFHNLTACLCSILPAGQAIDPII